MKPGQGPAGASRCQNFRTEPLSASTAVRISSSLRANRLFSTTRTSKTSRSVAGDASKNAKVQRPPVTATRASKLPLTVRSAGAKPRCLSGLLKEGRSSAANASRAEKAPCQPPLPPDATPVSGAFRPSLPSPPDGRVPARVSLREHAP
jgi:hypothetical protein